MKKHKIAEENFSFNSYFSYFLPFTTKKAIIWIIVVGLIVYFNMLFNGFVWDDSQYIVTNMGIHTINFSYLIGPNIFNTTGQYRFITALYFSFLYALFQNNTFFYHFFSLGIHITNSILLFYLLKRFITKPTSFFLSLIFLVHPIQTESVAYIASADNLLFFLFGMIALLLDSSEIISQKKILGIFVFVLLSLLSKETGILFLFCILLQRVFFRKKQRLVFLISSLATLLIYFVIRFVLGKSFFAKTPLPPIAHISFQDRMMNIPLIILYYIKTFFFPLYLAVEQQWVIISITVSSFLLPVLIDLLFFISLIVIGCTFYIKKFKNFSTYLFFLLWFIVGLGFYSQIVPLDATVADRWAYFTLAGLLGILGVIFDQLSKYYKKQALPLLVFLIFIISLLSLRTIVRNANWYNNITLFTHDSQVSDNYDIEYYLGGEYTDQKQYNEALVHYMKSVNFSPYELNLFDIGYVYEEKGDLKKAEYYYYKALLVKSYFSKPKHFEKTYDRLVHVLLIEQKYKNADVAIQKGLLEYPKSASLWFFLAIDEEDLSHHKEALAAVEKYGIFSPGPQAEVIYSDIQSNQKIKMH